VSHDFEVGKNVSCEESTVGPRMGLIFGFLLSPTAKYVKRGNISAKGWYFFGLQNQN